MTRSNARELAVHLIYAREFTGDEPQMVIATRLKKEYYEMLSEECPVYEDRPSRAQKAYIDSVVMGVANRVDELNETISKLSVGWDISRISRLARTVMQLALFEIQFVDDVPTGVAIAEAVRIAKLYDGDEAGAFVNGILGTFARNLTSEVEV
jgi:N utilization substance protein B